ncbi:hypothetical protein P171DRAFT_436857 [Karstenula rhodostoma CBS 690.94]|uniref:RING-type domain-containing protein n=1 Tax=Karstenula rhodostoma CBS 690.94 TaxID=1392251 RepID=A0A9P4U632_9PLEO|nr:hypothetical protein P171DRAFT_436857 [Karstenula rhodostoma CBS 690.94]
MDSELPFGYARRDKRSAAQMDLDGSASPTWSHIDRLSVPREPSATRSLFHPPRTNNMPAEAPRRFQGDGFDYRRPVVSYDNIIDLTHEDAGPSMTPTHSQQSSSRSARPPRFGREIIDVEEGDSSGAAAAPESPEIQFVSSRRIEPAQPPPLYELDDEDEDEVEFVRENPRPDSERRREIADEVTFLLDDPAYRPRVGHLRERVQQIASDRRARDAQIARVERMFAQARNRRTPRPMVRVHQGEPHALSVRLEAGQRNGPGRHIHVGFIAPALNFGAVGFDMGFENGPPEAPPPPTYNAPAPAPEGFTRSPQEEHVLLCPNCDDELCTGDSDQKRQVWLVKGCGHVYCGECMMNRHIKKSAKGKEKQVAARTKPFKECVVEGCQKRVSSKNAVIQVFL